MRQLSAQRRKVILLSSMIACLSWPATLLANHLHGSRFLSAFVIVWSLFLAAMLAYTIAQMYKLRSSR